MSDNPFHDVGSVFPGEVNIVSVTPQTPAGEALKLMLEKRFSQLPVIENGEVLGVFSLWSLAQQLALAPQMKVQELEVGELMEQLPTVTVKDSVHSILSLLDRHDALLVNSPQHALRARALPQTDSMFDRFSAAPRNARGGAFISNIKRPLLRF